MVKNIKIYKTQNNNMTTKIAIFKGKKARKTIHNNERWFSVVDVAAFSYYFSQPRLAFRFMV